jgi:hypothetical protein
LNGYEKAINNFDSTVVVGDTTIFGSKYWKICSHSCYSNSVVKKTQHICDSGQFFITRSADFIYNEVVDFFNFKDTIRKKAEVFAEGDTIYTAFLKIEKLDSLIIVPAGQFKIERDRRTTVFVYPRYTNIPNPRYNHTYYSKGVGKVYESFVYANSGTTAMKLIRYHLTGSAR